MNLVIIRKPVPYPSQLTPIINLLQVHSGNLPWGTVVCATLTFLPKPNLRNTIRCNMNILYAILHLVSTKEHKKYLIDTKLINITNNNYINISEYNVAEIKKYNLKGVGANVELGKKGSYISGSDNAISFYTVDDDLQKLHIANAVSADHAVTKAQLDALTADLVQHITYEFEYDSGSNNIANISTDSRIIGVTVDIPSAWTDAVNTSSYVEVGDTNNASRFLRAQDVDVTVPAQYHSQYQYEYASGGTLSINVVGGDATAGTGTVSILVSSDIITVTDYGSIGTTSDTNSDLGNIS